MSPDWTRQDQTRHDQLQPDMTREEQTRPDMTELFFLILFLFFTEYIDLNKITFTQREPSCTAGGNVNWYRHYGEQSGDTLEIYT